MPSWSNTSFIFTSNSSSSSNLFAVDNALSRGIYPASSAVEIDTRNSVTLFSKALFSVLLIIGSHWLHFWLPVVIYVKIFYCLLKASFAMCSSNSFSAFLTLKVWSVIGFPVLIWASFSCFICSPFSYDGLLFWRPAYGLPFSFFKCGSMFTWTSIPFLKYCF